MSLARACARVHTYATAASFSCYIFLLFLSLFIQHILFETTIQILNYPIYIYIILSSTFLFININEAYLFALFLHLSFTLCACKINYFLTRVCLCINASTNTCIMEHVITRGMRTLDGSYFFFFWLIRSRLIISFWQIVTLLLYCSNLD